MNSTWLRRIFIISGTGHGWSSPNANCSISTPAVGCSSSMPRRAPSSRRSPPSWISTRGWVRNKPVRRSNGLQQWREAIDAAAAQHRPPLERFRIGKKTDHHSSRCPADLSEPRPDRKPPTPNFMNHFKEASKVSLGEPFAQVPRQARQSEAASILFHAEATDPDMLYFSRFQCLRSVSRLLGGRQARRGDHCGGIRPDGQGVRVRRDPAAQRSPRGGRQALQAAQGQGARTPSDGASFGGTSRHPELQGRLPISGRPRPQAARGRHDPRDRQWQRACFPSGRSRLRPRWRRCARATTPARRASASWPRRWPNRKSATANWSTAAACSPRNDCANSSAMRRSMPARWPCTPSPHRATRPWTTTASATARSARAS